MDDAWSVLDLPVDCDTLHMRISKRVRGDSPREVEVTDAAFLMSSDRLPDKIRIQMEQERQGKWDLLRGYKGADRSRSASNDKSTLETAIMESEYGIRHERIINQASLHTIHAVHRHYALYITCCTLYATRYILPCAVVL